MMTNASGSSAKRLTVLALATLLATATLATTADAAPKQRTVRIPGKVALRTNDFTTTPMSLMWDSGQYPNQPTASGQFCDPGSTDADGTEPRPTGGRQWGWATSTDDHAARAASHVVTTWADGPAALADLQGNTGYCRFTPEVNPGFRVLESDAHTFIAAWGDRYLTSVAVTLRTGNTLISVTVDDYTGTADRTALTGEAMDLAQASAARALRSPLRR